MFIYLAFFLVTLSAPSKTFNIPVFAFSYVITTNPKLRTDFETAQGNAAVFMENVFGLLSSFLHI